MRSAVLILALCLAAQAAQIGPQITSTVSSDVPIAQVSIVGEETSYGADIIEGGPTGWQLVWTAYIGYAVNVACPGRTDPIYYCSEYWGAQTGIRDWTSLRHHASITYTWVIPMFVPGSGTLRLGNVISDSLMEDTGSDSGSLYTKVRAGAGLNLPTIIPRGKPFNATLSINVNSEMTVDGESFMGSQSVEQEMILSPEGSSGWLLTSGLIGLISLQRLRSRRWSRS